MSCFMIWLPILFASLPAAAHAGHAALAAPVAALTEAPDLSLQLTADPATVGTLSAITATLRDGRGAPVPATFYLTVMNLEDRDQIVATSVAAPSGRLDWQQQFYDGDEHEVAVRAVPLTGQNAAAARLRLAVTAVAPPRAVLARTFAYLMGVVLVAMALAFVCSRRLAA